MCLQRTQKELHRKNKDPICFMRFLYASLHMNSAFLPDLSYICVRTTYSGFMKVKREAASLSNRFMCLNVIRNHLQSSSIVATRNGRPKPAGSRLFCLASGSGRRSVTLSIFMFTAGRRNCLCSKIPGSFSHFYFGDGKWNSLKFAYCIAGE